MKKTVLITWSTGMVWNHVLKELLGNKQVWKIISIWRRKTWIKNKKLIEIAHDNFLDFSTLESQLQAIDVCIYCIWVYQTSVSKEDFMKITCDYQKALTDTLEKTSPDIKFVLFSAAWADNSEKSRMFFAKWKWRAENLLMQTCFPKKYIFRPWYIHPTTKKRPNWLLYKIFIPMWWFLLKIMPNIWIKDIELAKSMVRVALDEKIIPNTFENKTIKNIYSQLITW